MAQGLDRLLHAKTLLILNSRANLIGLYPGGPWPAPMARAGAGGGRRGWSGRSPFVLNYETREGGAYCIPARRRNQFGISGNSPMVRRAAPRSAYETARNLNGRIELFEYGSRVGYILG